MDELEHGIAKQKWILTILKSPCHLIEVGLQMLCRNTMPSANNAALQERESRLHRVRMKVAVNVLLRAVINHVMLLGGHRSFSQGGRVGHEVIRHNHIYIGRDVLADVMSQRTTLGVFRMKKPQFAAALTNSDYHFFCILPGP